MDEVKYKFNLIKNRKFFWPQSLNDRFLINPALSVFLLLWARFQTLLIYKLKIKKPFTTVKTFWGDNIKMILPHPTFLYFFGFLGRNEIFLTYFIINNLKKGDVFIDGGSNIGYYSLLAAKLVGSHGQVHSFEPTPEVFDILNINSKQYKNIFSNNLALLEEKKSLSFTNFGLKYSLYNSIFKPEELPHDHLASKKSNNIKIIDIHSISIDEYCNSNLVIPNFIKLDTEGTELQAILGAKNVINVYKPIISIEVWDYSLTNGNFQRIFQFLINRSYKCYQLSKDFTLIPILSIDNNIDNTFFNLVFLP